MTRRFAVLGAAVLLAGPTVLAFFSGGYFDLSRQWAGLLTWALVASATLIGRTYPPRSRPVWLAIAALSGLAVWTLVSTLWAPIAGNSWASGQRVVLYAGLLIAAALLAGDRRVAGWIEPGLTAGVLVVVGYGLSERLLPGLLHFTRDPGAQGRLEQPLTYWNAMGELAAIGLVLAVRLSGDTTRRVGVRRTALAASGLLGLGVSLSVSRGAVFAAVAGLICLVVVAPTTAQLRALGVAIIAAALTALAAAPFAGVSSLAGTLATRERQGAVVLVALVVIAGVAVLAHQRLEGAGERRLRLPRRGPALAVGLVCGGLAIAIAAGAHENTGAPLAGDASRLTTLQSDRYDYWRVAWKAFTSSPLRGVGAEGWSVDWLRYRHHQVGAQDAHSLPLQTLAELGVVGFALLLALIAGVALAARGALRRAPSLAAGPIAGCVVYLAHSPLDWDWQMPALTAVAVILAGTLLALAGNDRAAAPASAVEQGPVPRRLGVAGALTLGVPAALVCAWFVLAIGATQAEDRAARVLDNGPYTHASVAAALSDLQRAALLNPDRLVVAERASLLFRSGAHRAGLKLAQQLVRAEPENAQWWSLLGLLGQHGYPALNRLAQSRLAALVPPVPR